MTKPLGSMIVLATLVLAAPPRDAEACSCGHEPAVAPADGAVDVPTNAVVHVGFEATVPTLVLREVGATASIPLTVESHGEPAWGNRWLVARPGALAPSTRYEVTVTEGELPSKTIRFTTGTAADGVAPSLALRAFTPEVMAYPIRDADGATCASSCVIAAAGEVSRIRLEVDAAADVVLLEHELLAADGVTVLRTQALPATARGLFGVDSCGARVPAFDPAAGYCARLRAYDVAGNVATSEVECAPVARCAPRLGDQQCTPSDECVAVVDEPAEPDEAAPASGGCSAAGPGAGAMALAGLGALALLRRRRHRHR